MPTGSVLIRSLRVDFDRHRAFGPNGEVRLSPKLIKLLAILVEHESRVVSRSFLLDHVWAEGYGSEQSLTNAVSELRKVWREQEISEPVIETVPKRGYRLIADVEPVAAENRWRAIAVATGVLAVLIFLWASHELPTQPQEQDRPGIPSRTYGQSTIGLAQWNVSDRSMMERS